MKGVKKLPHVASDVALNVEIHPEQGVPLTLVRMAVERNGDPEVDECWCIFDVEWPQNHPHLREAVALANAKGIKLAISNPCFELWLILHRKDFTRNETTDAVESVSRSLDRRAGKSIDVDIYMPLRKDAARRVILLEKRHLRDGTPFPADNPSSGMHKFLLAIEGADWLK